MLLFPDSNFFLQCRHPAEIPWTDVTADDEIRLVASRTVQGEIDRLKGDGRERRSNRARKVSSWFAAVIDTGVPFVLRERSPRVTLELPPRIPKGHVYSPGLDMTRPDDRIVGEVLAFRCQAAEAKLLTDDTNMKLTAHDEGLSFVATPGSWRLDPEPDAKDRTIAELQRRVAVLERSGPLLEVAASMMPEGTAVPRRMRYDPLPEGVIDELLDTLRSRLPEKSDFSSEADASDALMRGRSGFHFPALAGMHWQPPSADAVADYGRRYTAWLVAVRLHLGRLHRSLLHTRLRFDIRWTLGNVGTLPAEGLIIDIEACGGLALVDPRSPPKQKPPWLPEPPEPPAWEMSPAASGAMGGLATIEAAFRAAGPRFGPALDIEFLRDWSGGRKPARDPYAFYRRGGSVRVLSRRWTFECAEFRHGRDSETFETAVLTVGPADDGLLRFRASSRNLPVPVEKLLRVPVVSCTGRIEDEARALVDQAGRAEALARRYRSGFRF